MASTSTAKPPRKGPLASKSRSTLKPPAKKTKTSKTKDEGKPFPFLQLPLEIRRLVYFYAVVKPLDRCYDCRKYHGHKVNGEKWGTIGMYTGPKGKRQFGPPLLQVNKQIRAESAPMYYGLNHLVVHVMDMHFCCFFAWLKILGPFSLELRSITFLMVGVRGWTDFSQFVALEQKHLSRECIVKSAGNFQMAGAFEQALITVKHLKSAGLGWGDIAKAMGNMTKLIGEVSITDPEDFEWAEFADSAMMELPFISGECPMGDASGGDESDITMSDVASYD